MEVSYPLGKPSFLNTLAHESLIYLRCPAPKLDDPLRTNHRVLFEDGWVYDFRDGSFSHAKRSDFFKRSLPWKHCRPDWWGNEEVRKAAKELMELLKKSPRASIVEDSLRTEETLGMRRRDARRVQELWDKLCAYDPFLKWLSASNEDVDEAIYVGKNFARALAGHPAFCELIWNCGPAQSGKDLGVAILQALAGTGSAGGYCATLKWGYLKTFRSNKAPAQSAYSAWFTMAATKLGTTKAFSKGTENQIPNHTWHTKLPPHLQIPKS